MSGRRPPQLEVTASSERERTARVARERKIPSYRLHKSTGKAIVTLNGHDIYLGAYGSAQSRAEYNRVIAEWLTNHRQLRPPPPTSIAGSIGRGEGIITIVELVDQYFAHVRSYYRKNGQPTSEVNTIKSALESLVALYGHTSAGDFGPLALKALREAMAQQGWCRKYINNQVSRVKTLFRWAVENELIPPSVHHGLLAVRGLRRGRSDVRESEPVRPVADHLVDAVRPFVSRQVWAMIDLQRITGMRSGEVTIMRGCDLDTSGRVWVYTPATHKTEHHGHARPIHLGPMAQKIIRPFLRPNVTEFLFSPADAEQERFAELRSARRTCVQPSQHQRAAMRRKRLRVRPPLDHYTSASYQRAIARACVMAHPAPKGLSPEQLRRWMREHHWHPHQLRHSAATRLRKDFGLEAARVVLGHRSAAVTQMYAEIDASKAHEIMLKCG